MKGSPRTLAVYKTTTRDTDPGRVYNADTHQPIDRRKRIPRHRLHHIEQPWGTGDEGSRRGDTAQDLRGCAGVGMAQWRLLGLVRHLHMPLLKKESAKDVRAALPSHKAGE